MKRNRVLRVRVHHTNAGGTAIVTRYNPRTKNIHSHSYVITHPTFHRIRDFLLRLDFAHKGRYWNHANGYSYLVWQGRKQNVG